MRAGHRFGEERQRERGDTASVVPLAFWLRQG